MDSVLLDAPPTKQVPPKSPPLAFQVTSNDSLWAPSFNPMAMQSLSQVSSPYFLGTSPTENDMQAQLDKLNEALRLQHQAFVAERESWQMERDRMQRRVSALESLLKSPNGQSPALSPQNGVKPAPSQLPSIAEVDTSRLSPEMPRVKRDAAPVHIDIPTLADASVFDSDAPLTEVLHGDLPASPPTTRNILSPPPPANLRHAGHTPLKAPRPGEFSPALSIRSDKLTDTPTRANTLMNEVMSQDDGAGEDRSLKGPLHMPSLPCNPGAENFTVDMLDAKLKDISEHPEENQPIVCQSTILALDEPSEAFPVPNEKVDSASCDSKEKAESPSAESKDKDALDVGIRLRTKMSSNFGAPLGSMGGWRR
ncbi:unnamed protein product [Aureobasidium mustum]|uniref:Uncharacterized protein n=1 Tax=Aureobasidium mustum TaxID=2773714 RepID=A0A9N8KAA1_9PEZI|nr:unnamed protein product [Aureobasidium mustum]